MPLRTTSPSRTSQKADETVKMAWNRLPASHRQLLESIGAHQWQVVNQPLGLAAEGFLLSAGMKSYPISTRTELDRALGIWLRELQIIRSRKPMRYYC